MLRRDDNGLKRRLMRGSAIGKCTEHTRSGVIIFYFFPVSFTATMANKNQSSSSFITVCNGLAFSFTHLIGADGACGVTKTLVKYFIFNWLDDLPWNEEPMMSFTKKHRAPVNKNSKYGAGCADMT